MNNFYMRNYFYAMIFLFFIIQRNIFVPVSFIKKKSQNIRFGESFETRLFQFTYFSVLPLKENKEMNKF